MALSSTVPIMIESLQSMTRYKEIVLYDFNFSANLSGNVAVNETIVTFRTENMSHDQIAIFREVFDSFPKAGQVAMASSSSSAATYNCVGTFGQACLISREIESDSTGQQGYRVRLRFTANSNKTQIMNMLRVGFKEHLIELIIRRNLTIDKLRTDNLQFSFMINDAIGQDAADLRRIILSDIPVMAIACTKFGTNSNFTAHKDEIMVQLLSNLVFDSSNVDHFVETQDRCRVECGIYQPQLCGVKYRLKAKGEPGRIITVTSDHFKPLSDPHAVYPVRYSIPSDEQIVQVPQAIIKLLPNHEIDVECFVSRGTQGKHARWSCVTTLGIENTNIETSFIIKGELRGNLTAEQIVEHLMAIVNRSKGLRIARV